MARLTQLNLHGHREKTSMVRIVNISSIGGKIYTPFGAWYHATKHALEGGQIVCASKQTHLA